MLFCKFFNAVVKFLIFFSWQLKCQTCWYFILQKICFPVNLKKQYLLSRSNNVNKYIPSINLNYCSTKKNFNFFPDKLSSCRSGALLEKPQKIFTVFLSFFYSEAIVFILLCASFAHVAQRLSINCFHFSVQSLLNRRARCAG